MANDGGAGIRPAITTPEEVHETFGMRKSHMWYAFASGMIPGATKIGDTTRDVPVRIEEWRKVFPDADILASGDLEVLPGIFVRDHALHKGCVERGYRQLQAEDFTDGIQHTIEAYDVAPADAPQLIPEIIGEVRAAHGDPASPFAYYSVDSDRKQIGLSHYRRDAFDWELRPMQLEAVDNIENATMLGIDNMLLDASVRFGKCFTTLAAAKRIGATRILVTSGKADVEEEWKKATEMPGQFGGWAFVSPDMLRASDGIVDEVEGRSDAVVAFMTLQDSYTAEEKRRYRQVLSRRWDLLVVDETHYGARAEQFSHAIDNVDRRYTLHLSGSPYRILASEEFSPGQIVACKTRADMIAERDAWDEAHAEGLATGAVNPWDNPYFGIPTPVTFALRANAATMARLATLDEGDVSSGLRQLLATGRDAQGVARFAHEDEVRAFLKMIDGDDGTLGFLGYDIATRNDLFRHMVLCLPEKDSCDAMARLLAEMSANGEFSHLDGYEVVNVAGWEAPQEYRKPGGTKHVVRDIARLAAQGKRTISLTVYRMLTGVTVPEWDTMLILTGTENPEFYEQATGRLMSPFVQTVTNEQDESDSYRINRKPYVVVVDFDPARTFLMAEQRSIAQRLTGRGIDEAVKHEMRYAPIITANEDGFRRVTPTDLRREISRYATKGIADEVDAIPVDPTMLADWDFMAAVSGFDTGADSGKRRQIEVDPFLEDGDELDVPDVDKMGEEDVTTDASDVSDANDGNVGDYDEEDASPVDDGDDAKAREAVKRKVRDFYFRMLAFSAAWQGKGLVKTVEDIRIRARTTATGREIAANLGILEDINTLCDTVDKFPNIKLRLDNAIYNISTLVNDPELTGMEKAKTLMERFGRLSSSEVATPLWVAEKMVDSIPETAFEKDTPRFLDLASKVGEMAYALVERCGRIEAETGRKLTPEIRSVTTSPIAYVLCVAVYRLLGLDYRQVAKFTSYDLLGKDIKTMAKTLRQDKDFYQIDLFDLVSGQADEKADEAEERIVDGTDDGTTGETGLLEFDAVVSNPPYQAEEGGRGSSKPSIYNEFMDLGYATCSRACFISPGRFLYNAGNTRKEWNERMLADKHLQVVAFYQKSADVFPDTGFKGSVVITYHDERQDFGTIGTFVPYTELDSAMRKVIAVPNFQSLNSIIYSAQSYKVSTVFHQENPDAYDRMGNKWIIASNLAEKLPNVFLAEKPTDTNEYIQFACRIKGTRAFRWILRRWIQPHANLDCWKVFVPKSNGSGAIGETLSTPLIGQPLIGQPLIGHSETYISIGAFANREEAEAVLKYVKTKFCRAMLGTKKITQHNAPAVWANVPLQDFTSDSDIDWSKSIDEIDEQLFDKYGLTDKEREFIKEKVQKMD